jgi:hypothetical protein
MAFILRMLFFMVSLLNFGIIVRQLLRYLCHISHLVPHTCPLAALPLRPLPRPAFQPHIFLPTVHHFLLTHPNVSLHVRRAQLMLLLPTLSPAKCLSIVHGLLPVVLLRVLVPCASVVHGLMSSAFVLRCVFLRPLPTLHPFLCGCRPLYSATPVIVRNV